jgi:hypothetical protein
MYQLYKLSPEDAQILQEAYVPPADPTDYYQARDAAFSGGCFLVAIDGAYWPVFNRIWVSIPDTQNSPQTVSPSQLTVMVKAWAKSNQDKQDV